MNDQYTVTINGLDVKVDPKTTVLQAAQRADIYIPTLCAHPLIEPFGSCRMCAVQIKGVAGLPSACITPVTQGMVVNTNTHQVREFRRATLELILSEHPQQCLTCHQNLRCELQQVAAYVGLDRMSISSHYKGLPVHTDDPMFDRDYNLCILCGRCVRMCQEIRGNRAIGFTYRDGTAQVGTPLGRPLEAVKCQFCGACVDVCPTGALAGRFNKCEGPPDYSVTTICPYCGVGCQLKLQVKEGKIIRSVPDVAGPANIGQACVKGRFGIVEFVHSPARLTSPLVRRNGELKEASWDEALDLVARNLGRYKPDELAVVTSAKGTNEENYVLQKLARAVLGTNNVDHCARL